MTAPSFDLDGRHVVVTGAGRGLGRAIAEAVAGAGARVTAAARTAAQLDDTVGAIRAAGGQATARQLDVGDLDGLDAWVDALEAEHPIDGVVHAAGVQLRGPSIGFTAEQWQSVTRINLDAPFLLSTAIGRRQLAAGRPGSHVAIGSLSSTIGLPNAPAYTASKSGIGGVVHALAIEWATSGIRVNGIAPGYFRTELTAPLLDQPDQRERLLGRIPMRRFGDPAELGGAAVFLLSDAASYVTGQLLVVDGGWLAG